MEASSPLAPGVVLDGKNQEGWVLESLRQALAERGMKWQAIALACGNSRESFASCLKRFAHCRRPRQVLFDGVNASRRPCGRQQRRASSLSERHAARAPDGPP